MSDDSISIKLRELFDLYKSGALTKEEYDLLKSKIISQDSKSHSNIVNIENEAIISQSTKLDNPIVIKPDARKNNESLSEKLVKTKKSKTKWLIILVLVALAIISFAVYENSFSSNKSNTLYRISSDTLSASLLPPLGLYERVYENGSKSYINILVKDGVMLIQTGDEPNILENSEVVHVEAGKDTTGTIVQLGMNWTIQYKGSGKLEQIMGGATTEGEAEEYIKVK